MTSLATRKTRLTFASEDCVRYRGKLRRIVVEVDRNGYQAYFRLEGTRARFPMSFAGMYNAAVKMEVENQRRAKAAAKKAKPARTVKGGR